MNNLTQTAATLGFVRTAAVSPALRVADVAWNTQVIVEALAQARQQRIALMVFPELCLTGYSAADLFYQSLLLDSAAEALMEIEAQCGNHDVCAVVGLPIADGGRIYNCAAFLSPVGLLGIVPKSFLPNTNEFYEERWFTSGAGRTGGSVRVGNRTVPFGVDLLFRARNMPGCVVGIEICEDLWTVEPPSGRAALAGATLLVNPSASTELLGKDDYRRDLVRQQSARCMAAYVYAASGPGESTTDVVYSGHSLIYENGTRLAEGDRFSFETRITTADLDMQRLNHERWRNSSFSAAAIPTQPPFRTIDFSLPRADAEWPIADLLRPLSRTPFVPADDAQRAASCREIFSIQATGLAKRLRHTGLKTVTIGLSGGLDSTLALLVAVHAFDMLGLPPAGIVGITMPGFGTTARTRTNAETLAAHLGVTLRKIDITAAVLHHFDDIGHDPHKFDVTYENAQARERTQILMDVANATGGLVVGTGDLSEAALGWMTFNGDHMSMYHVNAGVPKTLVRYLVAWAADALFEGAAATVLHDIVATPITPELLPLDANAQLAQRTEETIGPYELHDFFLFHAVRYQYPPRKVDFLARHAFAGSYDAATIRRWLTLFYRRFFSQQFKRSSMPDGPKVGTVALSPRGDWRMPSDASSALWLAEVEALVNEAAAAPDVP